MLDEFRERRGQLLSILNGSNFSQTYSHFHKAFTLMEQTGIEHTVDFRVPAHELLQLLISKKLFVRGVESNILNVNILRVDERF